MSINIDSINNILKPALKGRIGSNDNIANAKRIAQQQLNRTSFSAGELSFAMFAESVDWAGRNLNNVDLPPIELDPASIDAIKRICNQANNTHNSGGRAAMGAAIGANYGLVGMAIGAIFGWASGQNAANNDIQGCITYANQAVDYFCNVLVNKSIAYINSNPNTQVTGNTEQKYIEEETSQEPEYGITIFGDLYPGKRNRNNRSQYVLKHITLNQGDSFKLYDYKNQKEFVGSIDPKSNNNNPYEFLVITAYGYLAIKDCLLTICIKLNPGNDMVYYEAEAGVNNLKG